MPLMTYPLSLPEIVHGVPGRLRVRVPSLQASPDLTATLEAQVKATPAVETVRISTATDSIIVSYRPLEPDTTEAQIYQLITQITQEFFAPNLHHQSSPEALSSEVTPPEPDITPAVSTVLETPSQSEPFVSESWVENVETSPILAPTDLATELPSAAPELNDLPNDPPNDDLTNDLTEPSDVISDLVDPANEPIEPSDVVSDLIDPANDPIEPGGLTHDLISDAGDPVDPVIEPANLVNALVDPIVDPVDQNSVNDSVEPSSDPVDSVNSEELGDPEPVPSLPQLEPDGISQAISEVTSEVTPDGISELIAAEEPPIPTNERPAPPAKAPRRPNPAPRKPRNRKKPEPN